VRRERPCSLSLEWLESGVGEKREILLDNNPVVMDNGVRIPTFVVDLNLCVFPTISDWFHAVETNIDGYQNE
jgi:hypothetical protein